MSTSVNRVLFRSAVSPQGSSGASSVGSSVGSPVASPGRSPDRAPRVSPKASPVASPVGSSVGSPGRSPVRGDLRVSLEASLLTSPVVTPGTSPGNIAPACRNDVTPSDQTVRRGGHRSPLSSDLAKRADVIKSIQDAICAFHLESTSKESQPEYSWLPAEKCNRALASREMAAGIQESRDKKREFGAHAAIHKRTGKCKVSNSYHQVGPERGLDMPSVSTCVPGGDAWVRIHFHTHPGGKDAQDIYPPSPQDFQQYLEELADECWVKAPKGLYRISFAEIWKQRARARLHDAVPLRRKLLRKIKGHKTTVTDLFNIDIVVKSKLNRKLESESCIMSIDALEKALRDNTKPTFQVLHGLSTLFSFDAFKAEHVSPRKCRFPMPAEVFENCRDLIRDRFCLEQNIASLREAYQELFNTLRDHDYSGVKGATDYVAAFNEACVVLHQRFNAKAPGRHRHPELPV